jgi:lipoprotein-releasing system ATP-binding protein
MQITALVCKKITQRFIEYGVVRTIIDNLSISFQKGERSAVTGISGAGKSTLLYLLAGLDQPVTGSVFISCADEKILSSADRYRQQKIGIVLQSAYLIHQLTVKENIVSRGLIAGMSIYDATQNTTELLKAVGLAGNADEYPSTLSGGQQQRVALARALITQPDFLLADEPTSALDQKTAAQVMELIFYHQKMYGMGLIIATHDQQIIESMDTIFELKNGTVHQRLLQKGSVGYGQTIDAQENS